MADVTARRVRQAGRAVSVWRRFRRHRAALLGAVLIVVVSSAALAADWLAPYPPDQQDLSRAFELPSRDHWLGTDEFGRDVLSRLIYGARVSLGVGVLAIGVSASVGCLVGVTAGYYGGPWDAAAMRAMDILLAFPGILLAIAVMAFLGPGTYNAMVAIAIVGIPAYARVSRGVTLSVKRNEYVQAAIASGASNVRILCLHVLPNALAPLIVQSTLGIASAILSMASLSFLGLGVQPPTPDWGSMLASAQDFLITHPFVAFPPGLAILLTVLAFNLVGDGLRDALDPKLR